MIHVVAIGLADDDLTFRGCSAAACDLFVACVEVLFSDANPFAVGVPGDPSGSHDVAGSSVAAGISPRAIAGDSICLTSGLPPATLPTAASIPEVRPTTKADGFGVEKLC